MLCLFTRLEDASISRFSTSLDDIVIHYYIYIGKREKHIYIKLGL